MAPELGDNVQLVPGDIVASRYRIVRLIGRGGMGEVYEARDESLAEAIALKALRADLANLDESDRRFQNEIQLSRKVTHPNVCRVFDAGLHQFPDSTWPPLRFFTMELLSGQTLSERIRSAPRLPSTEAFSIAVQLAEGLNAAHRAGIVHADFKSGNVILVAGPRQVRAVITDFGLSRIDPAAMAAEATRSLTVNRKIVGTLAYMSPEQLSGGEVTAASDIYSFGIVLFEMATGTLPFDERHVIHAAVQRASGDGISARSLDPHIDSRWDAAIARCLQNDPARRFGSTQEIAERFREDSWRAPWQYWTRREWMRVGLSTGTAAAAGAFSWTWIHRPFQPKPAALERYNKGVAALHSMTYETARRHLEQAVAADPGFALAHASLSRAYDELDYTERAKESMLAAVTVGQESRRLLASDRRRLRALQHLVSREYDLAGPLLQAIEREAAGPERAPAALENGWLAQQLEKTGDAEAAYRRALEIEPRYAAAKLRLGYILGRRGQTDNALKAFQEAEELYSSASDSEGVTETLIWRASLLNRRGRAAEAVPVIERALAVARILGNTSQQIRLQFLEGVSARNLGDPLKAGNLAQQAVEAAIAQRMESVAMGGLIDIGNSFLLRGEPEPAERYYRRALEFARRSKGLRNEARAQASLGSVCELGERPEEARQFLEAALAFYGQAGYQREWNQSTLLLGGVYEQLGTYERGVSLLRHALPAVAQLGDTEAPFRERLAGLLRAQGGWVEALDEFERAAKLYGKGGQSSYAKLNAADLFWRLGRRREAVHEFEEVEQALLEQSNPLIQSFLNGRRAEMAYADGDLARAGSLAGRSNDLEGRLIADLVAIRKGRPNGAEPISALIASLEKSGLAGRAASARLSAAEAILTRGDREIVLKMIGEALYFFEPRHIWESQFRAHVLAARASSAAQAAVHSTKARDALAALRSLWLPTPVAEYLRRPDIRTLIRGVQL